MRYRLKQSLPMMKKGDYVELDWLEHKDHRAIKQEGFCAVVVVPIEKFDEWIEKVHECDCGKCKKK